MMLAILENVDLAAFRTLLVGIPESVGLLVFGIGLVATAVLIRRMLGRADEVKTEQKIGKKV